MIDRQFRPQFVASCFDFIQLAARKGALGLELKGLRRSGHRRTAYSICKSEYGLKGSRQSVYDQMCALVKQAIDN